MTNKCNFHRHSQEQIINMTVFKKAMTFFYSIHLLIISFQKKVTSINFVYTSLTIEIFFISTIVINYTLTIKVVKMFITRQLVVIYNIYMYFKMTVNSNDT